MFLTQEDGIIMGPLSRLLGWIMNAIYNVLDSIGIPNIAICIIVFTLFVRLCLYPLNLKQTKSSRIQRYLQPQFNKITKKYRNKKDQESMLKQNQEIRELQSEYGIKMTSGCLTSIIQLPIFFALYNVIRNIPAYVDKVKSLYTPIAEKINDVLVGGTSTEVLNNFASENGIVGVSDVTVGNTNQIIDILDKCDSSAWNSLKEVFTSHQGVINAINEYLPKIQDVNDFIFGIDMTEAPGFRLSWALIIPILSMVFQYLSLTIMPMQDSSDPQQQQSMAMMKIMTKIMPIFSFVVCIGVPAGVGLYWATGSLISFLMTLITNKYYDHCDMEKLVEKQKEKAAKKNARKKKKGKKSFMEKLTEAAYGSGESSQTSSKYMENINSTKLKNYTSNTSAETNKDVKYRAGSIASKANALKQYNEKGGKE